MIIANIIAFTLVLIGTINWGLVGIFNWNVVTAIFGPGVTIGGAIIYVLIFLAGLWLLGYVIYTRGRIDMEARKINSSKSKSKN